jgi:hypothetical protein
MRRKSTDGTVTGTHGDPLAEAIELNRRLNSRTSGGR